MISISMRDLWVAVLAAAIAALLAVPSVTVGGDDKIRAKVGKGKPAALENYDDYCNNGFCDHGLLHTRENSWTKSPCGPEAIVNAMRWMCSPQLEATWNLRG